MIQFIIQSSNRTSKARVTKNLNKTLEPFSRECKRFEFKEIIEDRGETKAYSEIFFTLI